MKRAAFFSSGMKKAARSSEITLEQAHPHDPEVRSLYADFIYEADGPLDVDHQAEADAGPPAELVPPTGMLLLARVSGEPAGIGGVRHLDTPVAEVKSMYVSPTHRGIGLGRRLLAELDAVAARHGCRAVRLDTSDYLAEAIGLYRAAGYREVAAYNENPKASLWFEREL
jgi:GNAT superfamily N-acetyltransferase